MAHACDFEGCGGSFSSAADLECHRKNLHFSKLCPAFGQSGKPVCKRCGIETSDKAHLSACSYVRPGQKAHAKKDSRPRPEYARPEAVRPEAAKPESKKPEAAKPESAKPEAAKPESKKRKFWEASGAASDFPTVSEAMTKFRDILDGVAAGIRKDAESDLGAARSDLEALRSDLAAARSDLEKARSRVAELEATKLKEASASFGDAMKEWIASSFSARLVKVSPCSPFGRVPDADKVVPPVLILEDAFPGRSFEMLKEVVPRLEATYDGKVVGKALRTSYMRACMRYHTDKIPHAPSQGIALINRQYEDLQHVFSRGAGATKGFRNDLAEYHNLCAPMLKEGKPWRKFWDYMTSPKAVEDVAQAAEGHKEAWIAARVKLVDQLIKNGDRVEFEDDDVACYGPDRELPMPPQYPLR